MAFISKAKNNNPSAASILDEEYAERQMNKMEKQTEKLEGTLKEEGPQHEVKRQHEWFQTNKEKREEKDRLALTRHQGKGERLYTFLSYSIYWLLSVLHSVKIK